MTPQSKAPAKPKSVKAWAIVHEANGEPIPWLIRRTRKDAWSQFYCWIGPWGTSIGYRAIRVSVSPL